MTALPLSLIVLLNYFVMELIPSMINVNAGAEGIPLSTSDSWKYPSLI